MGDKIIGKGAGRVAIVALLAAILALSMLTMGSVAKVATAKKDMQRNLLTIDDIEAYMAYPFEDPPPHDYWLYLELTNREPKDISFKRLIVHATDPNGGVVMLSDYFQGAQSVPGQPFPPNGWRYTEVPLSHLSLKPGKTLCFGHEWLVLYPAENNVRRQPNCPQRGIRIPADYLVGACSTDGQGSFIIPDLAIEYTVNRGSYEITKRSYFGNLEVKCYGRNDDL